MKKTNKVTESSISPKKNQQTAKQTPNRATGRMTTSHLAVERMVIIQQKLASALKSNAPAPTLGEIAEELGVSTKTVRRDVAFMRERLELPMEYDHAERRYGYTNEVAGFPLMQMTGEELLALLVAREAIQLYEGTPYAPMLERAFKKLALPLGNVTDFDVANVSGAISFSDNGRAKVDQEVFSAVLQAVLDREEIEFDYVKPWEPDTVQHWSAACPLHVCNRGGMWYLIVRNEQGRNWSLALPRLRQVKRTKKYFDRENNFSVESHFEGAFGVFRGDGNKTHQVRIAFDAYAGALVSERVWHKTQELRPLKNGGVELRMTVSALDEVAAWVLSHAGRAKAIAPAELVTKVREAAKTMAETH